jgi:predicted ATP-dependent Lon-type protease
MATILRRPLSLEEVAALGSMTLNEASALLHAHAQTGKLAYDSSTQKWMVPTRE